MLTSILLILAISIAIGELGFIVYLKRVEKDRFVSKLTYDELTRCETLDTFLGINATRRAELELMISDIVSLVNSLQEELNMIKMLCKKHNLTANEQFFVVYAIAKMRGSNDGKRAILNMVEKLFSKLGGGMKAGFTMSAKTGEVEMFGGDEESDKDSKKPPKNEEPPQEIDGDSIID